MTASLNDKDIVFDKTLETAKALIESSAEEARRFIMDVPLQDAEEETLFAQYCLLVAINSSKENAARTVLDGRGLFVEPAQLALLQEMACVQHCTNIALYLSQKMIEQGTRPADAWRTVFACALPRDGGVIATRIRDGAVDKQAALNEALWAAVRGKAYLAANTLLDMGADPNVENGKVLVEMVSFPANLSLAQNGAYFEALKMLFKKGYSDKGLVDDMLVAAASGEASKLDNKITLILLRNGADPFGRMSKAQKIWEKYSTTREGDPKADLDTTFATYQEIERQSFKNFFRAIFGDNYTLHGLLQSRQSGETGLHTAARAQMLGEILKSFSLADIEQWLTIEAVTRQCSRRQSVLSLMADRGRLEELLSPRYWMGREKEILTAVFATLSPERLEGGGFEALQAAQTRERLMGKANKRKWRL